MCGHDCLCVSCDVCRVQGNSAGNSAVPVCHIQYNTLLNGPSVLFLQGGVTEKSGFPQRDHLLLM